MVVLGYIGLSSIALQVFSYILQLRKLRPKAFPILGQVHLIGSDGVET